jgi:hypothetical protein
MTLTDKAAFSIHTATEYNELLAAVRSVRVPYISLKPADQSVTSSTVLVNDTALLAPLEASTTYSFRLWLIVNSPSASNFKSSWTVPAGASMKYSFQEGMPSVLGTVLQGPFTEASTLSISTTGSDQIMIQEGSIVVGATPGTATFRWAQNTSGGVATIVRARSLLTVQEIG